MSYVLVAAVLLMFQFLWSRLPDPAGRRPKTVNGTPEHQCDDAQRAKADERSGVRRHPDQIGEVDERGRIKIGVSNWVGPDPVVRGYVPCRIDLDHVARPPRVVTYGPQQIRQLPRP